MSVVLERVAIHGAALEGNLEGNATDREALVFLPPSYAREVTRRYPVVYALHGYSVGAEQWAGEIGVPATIGSALAAGVGEVLVILPDSRTVHDGSMYSSSVTTGDFERFIARDVVAFVDARYRTLPMRESRGLVGHSMGGYGATRIGMKHPDVFGSLYVMSPCCLSPPGSRQPRPELDEILERVHSPSESSRLPFLPRARLATAAAWSPNPNNPPLYLDLPVKHGVPQARVIARWTANSPLALLDQYVGSLRRYRAIGIDVGDRDDLLPEARSLHEALDDYAIPNSFEIYEGTHTSRLAERFQEHVLPFFGRSLHFDER
jgi:enterochelin esterase-like enzyme